MDRLKQLTESELNTETLPRETSQENDDKNIALHVQENCRMNISRKYEKNIGPACSKQSVCILVKGSLKPQLILLTENYQIQDN